MENSRIQIGFNSIAGGIVLKERNEIKPSEITIGYLANELKVLNSIDEHDYDINIHKLNFKTLNFLKSSKGLIELVHAKNILSIDKMYQLKLLDLSSVGIGLSPKNSSGAEDESSRYRYLNDLIECANEAISIEKAKANKHNNIWHEQYKVNLKKFEEAQCKNKINIAELNNLRKRLRDLIKKIDKQIVKKNVDSASKLVEECYHFMIYKLFVMDEYLPNVVNKETSIFKQLSMDNDCRLITGEYYAIKELDDKLNCYRYIFNVFYYFLSSDLKVFKQKKIKRATDCFLTNSQELKRVAINNINESNYEELNKFDLDAFYDLYRNSIIGHLNKIIDADIKKRKVVDGFFQYTPSATGVILFFVSLGLSFAYTFTLLKEMRERHVLMVIFACISGCAIIALINLYRNAKVFKRPKRKKFSVYSLVVYLLISIVFFSLNMFYIYRYDGYNNTYYYVYDEHNEIAIVIDGLRNEDKTIYQIPEKIDNLNISQISDKVFKNNKNIIMVDLSRTDITTISKDCFLGCTNLEKVVLPKTLTTISKNAFKNCSNLQTVVADGVVQIGEHAFYGCKNLKSIDLSNVVELGNNAFENCSSIGLVTFNSNLVNIPAASFKNCFTLSFNALPQNLLSIGKEAFSGCGELKDLIIPGTTNSIGKEAFANCYNIRTLDIGNYNAIKKGDLSSVFGKLNSLTKITLNNVSTIPSDNFAFCPNVQSVFIEGSAFGIGNNAFKDCSSLVSCNISGNVEKIDAKAFYNCSSLKELNFNELNLSEISRETFYNCSSLETFIIPNTVQSIGDKAFYGCAKFTDIVVPSTVSKIGSNVFASCISLKNITIPITSSQDKLSNICDEKVASSLSKISITKSNNIPNNYFENCVSLKNLNFDNLIKNIGSYAFKNCSNLDDFSFVVNAIQIGEGAFYGCKKLSNIELNASLVSIPNYAFFGCHSITEVALPSRVTTIGSYSYANCSQLKKADLSKNIVTIGDNAFATCYNIQEIRLPLLKKSIKDSFGEDVAKNISTITVDITADGTISDYYFADCAKLDTITINGSISSIGKYAFSGCSSLKTMNIPNTVIKIEDCAFNDCSSLETIFIPTSVSYVGNHVFNGCYSVTEFNAPIANTESFENYFSKTFGNNVKSITLIGTDTIPNNYFENFTNLKNIDLTQYKHIGDEAFKNTGLTTLTIPQDITSVGSGTFSNCSKLKEVEIESSLNIIPNSLFANCSKLENANIPTSVKEIGTSAFSNCSNLSSIGEWSNIRKINSCAFENCKKLEDITLDKITYLGENAFSKCNLSEDLILSSQAMYAKNAFNNVNGVKTLTIKANHSSLSEIIEYYLGNTVESLICITIEDLNVLGKDFFSNCSDVKKIAISGDIKTIEKDSFSDLGELIEISLPDSVEIIKEYAFRNCIKLEKINLPKNTKIIEKFAFSDCTNLSSIKLMDNIEYIGKKAINENTIVFNSDDEHQTFKAKWHKNWDSQRLVTFVTVMEDISDFVINNYVTLIISYGSILVGCTVLIVIRRAKKHRKKPESDVKIFEDKIENTTASQQQATLQFDKVSVKYRGLTEYLLSTNGNRVTLSYSQIEKILGFPLPKTARKCKHQYWANTETHSYASSWMAVGYKARVDVENDNVTFIKNLI